MKTTGKVTGIIANLVTVEVDGPVAQNEICFIDLRARAASKSATRWNSKATCLKCPWVPVCFRATSTACRTISPP